MSKIPCGGFKIDDETLKFNENDELTVVGGSGGGSSDSVVWFSFSSNTISSAYNSGKWKVGRDWDAQNENPTSEDVLNAFENNNTVRANVFYSTCGTIQHTIATMTSYKFNTDETLVQALFVAGASDFYMTDIPYTKE